MDKFRFELTQEEKDYLKKLAFLSIRAHFDPATALPPPPTPRLEQNFGAFVTLKINHELRGCIGHIIGDGPLHHTVAEMAAAAAFRDPRFPGLTQAELPRVTIEISILSPLVRCSAPGQIEVGRHGLLMRRGNRSGLLLPQVPVEWGWSRDQFLAQTCRKAGLPVDAWRDPGTDIYWFEAVVF